MSWKKNPYKHLYEWIIGLRDRGYDHEAIMEAFENNHATKLDRSDPEQVKLADVIIRHALGRASDAEIEKYCPPTSVLDIRPYGECLEGFVFMATTPENEEDFYFLVDSNAIEGASSIEDINHLFCRNKSKVCKLVLYKAHTQHPYGVSGMPFEVAKAKLTWRDITV